MNNELRKGMDSGRIMIATSDNGNAPYVEQSASGYRLAHSRVSLDSIVHAYWNGQTAESIAQSFPEVTLEQIHGALAFYLANRSAIDAYLAGARTEYDRLREETRQADPMFYQKLADARRSEHSARP
jgi:uncharacterized protein (DUF433 family)